MTKEKLLKIFMILDIVFTLEIAISFVLSTYNFSFQPFLIKLDLLALFYFLIEFIIKVFLDRKNLKEFFSNFYNLLDSLVILAFLGYLLFDLTSTRALVEIRIINLIRLLVLLRVFKLRKYSQSPFVLNFVTVTTLMFIFSCILWVVESNVNPGIKNFMDAFYFTVITFTTIGYGDITPQTTLGKLIIIFGIIAIISGLTTNVQKYIVKEKEKESTDTKEDLQEITK